jgi:hypothetical protein
MRGFLQPGKRATTTEDQQAFAALSRGRRAKIAAAASTSLVKADQWARGGAASAELADALVKGLKTVKTKKK